MRKILSICIVALFFLLILQQSFVAVKQEPFHMILMDSSMGDEFEGWEYGSQSGPNLWHVTTIDMYSGTEALGCFNDDFRRYENNMDFNYALAPVVSIQDALDMIMEYYCKYITEDSDDYWGVCMYDPATETFFSHGSFYGYEPTWEKKVFNIKDAYDYWYSLGYFRKGNGSRSYDIQVGFTFIESDNTGTTNTTAEIHGVYWSGIFIDDVTIKKLTFNSPPETPDTPTGPSTGKVGDSISFSTVSTDPDGDMIRYGWDWNNDDVVDSWTNYFPSGQQTSIAHEFSQAGTYTIQVKAEDDNDLKSGFSGTMTIQISSSPSTPILMGPTSGKTGQSYTYSAVSTDPENDQLSYLFTWGDGTNSGWLGPFDSGETMNASHSWTNDGTYSIQVKARDSQEIESAVATIQVSMPKSKGIEHFLARFFPELFSYLSLFSF